VAASLLACPSPVSTARSVGMSHCWSHDWGLTICDVNIAAPLEGLVH
jgi:hypothetical protein